MASSGDVPVSVCTHRLSQNEEHWLVMMENVERVSACVSFSQDVSQSLFSNLSHVIIHFSFLFCHIFNKNFRFPVFVNMFSPFNDITIFN